jgi:tetratricopeptide (TPR) repeat protein
LPDRAFLRVEQSRANGKESTGDGNAGYCLLPDLIGPCGRDHSASGRQAAQAQVVRGGESREPWRIALAEGRDLERSGHLLQAERLFHQQLEDAERAEPDSERVAALAANLASVEGDLGRFYQAIPHCERALRIFERTRGAEAEVTLHVVHRLGYLYLSLGKYSSAESLLETVLRSEARLGAGSASLLAATHRDAAYLHLHRHQPEKAEREATIALQVAESKDIDRAEVTKALDCLATVLLLPGKPAEALAYNSVSALANPVVFADSAAALAMTYLENNQTDARGGVAESDSPCRGRPGGRSLSSGVPAARPRRVAAAGTARKAGASRGSTRQRDFQGEWSKSGSHG